MDEIGGAGRETTAAGAPEAIAPETIAGEISSPVTRTAAELRRSQWTAVWFGAIGLLIVGSGSASLTGLFGPAGGVVYVAVAVAVAILTLRGSFGGLAWIFGGCVAFSVVWAVWTVGRSWGQDPLDPTVRAVLRTKLIPLRAAGGLLWCSMGTQWGQRLWRGESIRSSQPAADASEASVSSNQANRASPSVANSPNSTPP